MPEDSPPVKCTWTTIGDNVLNTLGISTEVNRSGHAQRVQNRPNLASHCLIWGILKRDTCRLIPVTY